MFLLVGTNAVLSPLTKKWYTQSRRPHQGTPTMDEREDPVHGRGAPRGYPGDGATIGTSYMSVEVEVII